MLPVGEIASWQRKFYGVITCTNVGRKAVCVINLLLVRGL